MKKSKVIIPALAAIAFSTIASVTGTVAWFTSQSSVSISTSSFKVSGLEGELSVTPTAGIGTTVSGADKSTSISTASGVELTHGSFDHKTKKVYTYDQFSGATASYKHNAGAVLGEGMTEVDWKETQNGNKYNAVSWSLTFKYGSGTNGSGEAIYLLDKPVNLYFDIRSTISNASSSTLIEEENKNPARGFRVAFINDEDSVAKVWSPLQGVKCAPAKTADSCYVSGTSATTVYDTDEDGDLMWMGEQDDTTAALKYITGTEGTKNRTDFIGQFNSTNKGIVTVKFVAWFEGCDPNVENVTGQLPTVGTNMGFYVKQDATVA